ncbi:MAG: PAS domain-containing protein [Alphaproteobacteria bacterium]|uniref:Oxygen sensor histidine kinase NreB n=1 Tax=Candidatus Nitrobium versatile TaxID=2884831 RepID=A0A953JBU6_9BACT|nr:PAS domain-containing protein [Candidatus Nitrobium versatile]
MYRQPPESNRKALQDETLAEQVKQLYALAPFGLLASFLNSLIVFFVLKDALPHRILLTWLIAMAVITLLRVALVLWFRRKGFRPAAARTWKDLFIAGLALSGVVWGSVGIFPFSGVSLAYQVFIVFFLGGMAAGAAATFSAVKEGYLAYSIPALVPLAIKLCFKDDALHFAMGSMLFLYGLILWKISRKNHEINHISLLLRFENRGMIEQMKSAKEHTDELNRKLLAEIGAKERAEAELRSHHDHLERLVAERTNDLTRTNRQLQSEIEERKQTEQALRESEGCLAQAQRLAHIGNWEWDFRTGQEHWSDEAYRILGWNPRECEPSCREFLNRVHPEDRESIEKKIREALQEYRDYEYDCRIITRDGAERFIHTTAQITYAGSGRPVRIVGTIQDVTEQIRAKEELEKSREQLRRFAAHLQSVIENERTMIAREIHDELAQALTVMKIDLVDLAGDFREARGAGCPAAFHKVRAMTSYIDEVIRNVHRIAMELRPSILDDLGLEAAIEWQLAEFRKRTKIGYELRSAMESTVLSPEITTALFRIFQEALTNIARHAGADSVEVGLRTKGERVLLTVKDNGKGIEEKCVMNSRSLGIIGMRERVAVLGGDLSITGERGKGTTVTVSLPLKGRDPRYGFR